MERKRNKTTASITVDALLLEELRKRRINISGLINELIEGYLNIKEDTNEQEINEIIELENQAEAELIAIKQKRRILEENKRRKQDEVAEKIKKGDLIVLD
jgi:post-segregation antitoxin (ccd killing protein)